MADEPSGRGEGGEADGGKPSGGEERGKRGRPLSVKAEGDLGIDVRALSPDALRSLYQTLPSVLLLTIFYLCMDRYRWTIPPSQTTHTTTTHSPPTYPLRRLLSPFPL